MLLWRLFELDPRQRTKIAYVLAFLTAAALLASLILVAIYRGYEPAAIAEYEQSGKFPSDFAEKCNCYENAIRISGNLTSFFAMAEGVFLTLFLGIREKAVMLSLITAAAFAAFPFAVSLFDPQGAGFMTYIDVPMMAGGTFAAALLIGYIFKRIAPKKDDYA